MVVNLFQDSSTNQKKEFVGVTIWHVKQLENCHSNHLSKHTELDNKERKGFQASAGSLRLKKLYIEIFNQ